MEKTKLNAIVSLETREWEGKQYEVLVLTLPDTSLGSVQINTKGIRLTDVEKVLIKNL